jgi:hypothetical protein
MVGTKSLGRLLRADLGDVGHVAGDAALDHELAVDLDLGEELLHLDGKVLAVLRRVLLLDRRPRPAQVLVKGEAEQNQEGGADHEEGTS